MSFIDQLKKQVAEQLKTSLGENYNDDLLKFDDVDKLYNDDITGLKNKNSELITKLKTESIGKQVDLDEYKRLKEEAEQRTQEEDEAAEQKAKDAKNIEFLIEREKNKLIKAQERWNQDKTALEETVNSITKKYYDKLQDLDLTRALKEVHVGDKFMKFVKSSMLSQADVELDDDGRENVVFNLNGATVPIKEYITSWAEEDEAKSVIVPPTNSGGGASGSNGGVSGSKRSQLMEQHAQAISKGDAARAIAIEQALETMGSR